VHACATVLIAEFEVQLQNVLNKVNDKSSENGLSINIKKTKSIVVSKKNPKKSEKICLKLQEKQN